MRRTFCWLFVLVASGCAEKPFNANPNSIEMMNSSEESIILAAEDIEPERAPEANLVVVDATIPELTISFAKKHQAEESFAVLDGDVFFAASAKDNSGLPQVALVAPQLIKIDDNGNFGPMSIEHRQESMEIALVCSKQEEFQQALQARSLNAKEVYCACFEANDAVGNSQKEMKCFRRRDIKTTIVSPENDAVFDREALRQGVHVKAFAKSGVAFKGCTWAIRSQNSDEAIIRGRGEIAGEICRLSQRVDTSQLPNGTYLFVFEVRDVAERRSGNENNATSFQIRHDMMRMPDRNIIIRH